MAERRENQGRIGREREEDLSSLPQIQYWVCCCECVHCGEVLFTMAGSLFGRLSLEDGDSANSLEGLEIKLGGEGKNRSLPAGCVRGCSIVYKSDNKSATATKCN